MAVGSPFDILELRPEGELITRVVSVEEGPMTITPRDQRAPKVIQGVRLHVPPEDKQTEPPWWDITSQTAKPTILALAPQAITHLRWLRIHKYGSGPGARFGVDLLPVDYKGGPKAETLNQAGP